jgi:hypothetical protein
MLYVFCLELRFLYMSSMLTEEYEVNGIKSKNQYIHIQFFLDFVSEVLAYAQKQYSLSFGRSHGHGRVRVIGRCEAGHYAACLCEVHIVSKRLCRSFRYISL